MALPLTPSQEQLKLLLVTSPTFQEALVDKDGTAMAGGTVTCYQDNSRTTLKNWYYQSGTPGNYTYIRLPNPLTLSSAGSVCDINGVDTMPFFYPYSELDDTVRQPYYITIVNKAKTNQITRANFPFLPTESIVPDEAVNSFNNLIVNNGFWRNIAPNAVNVTPTVSYTYTTTDTVVAPSQHDGFRYPDIHFLRNNNSAMESVTFTPFPVASTQPITNDIVPEYYISHNTSTPGSGETQKCYQFPIALHINSLANVQFTGSIQAQNGGGTATGQNVIGIYLFQDTGTGTTAPDPKFIENITLSPAWTTYPFTFTFPDAVGLSLSAGSDDAFYLQIQMPFDLSCTINFTKPSIYLTNGVLPTNSFTTYDQVDAIISSPRTGDVRTSLNGFYPFGWVAMNDATIGNASSNANSRNVAYAGQDAWPLFKLLWTLFSAFPTSGYAPIFTSSGAASTYGASAIADWTANKAISVTRGVGQVILGTVPPAKLPSYYTSAFTSTSSVITATTSVTLWNGIPIYFTGVHGGAGYLNTGVVYYVSGYSLSGGISTFSLSSTFVLAMAGTTITFTNDSGTFFAGLVGSELGENGHVQLLGELAAHAHTFPTYNTAVPGTNITAQSTASNLDTVTTSTVGSTNTPMNVMQPSIFYNLYMKL